MTILTVTLNPAFDLHGRLAHFAPEQENYVGEMIREAGGKGINTARALAVNGERTTAFMVLGNENAAPFEMLLQRDGLRARCVYVRGAVRENITLHPADAPETRISLDTFAITPDALAELEAMMQPELRPGMWVAFGGRLPRGVTAQAVIGWLCRMVESGVQLAVDSNSFTAAQLQQIHPTLIKPNAAELNALCPEQPDDPVAQARQLVKCGAAKSVLASLGAKGLWYTTADGCLHAAAPAVAQPISTIGAGDSALAGYLAAAAHGAADEDRVRAAAAWGTAACKTPGTRPPRFADIQALLPQVAITHIK